MYVVNTQRMELGRGYLYVVNTKVLEEARLPSYRVYHLPVHTDTTEEEKSLCLHAI